MLLELRIENLLLIERAELRLDPGLNAITGETGAGKTVLAHSLDLLLGGRARPQIVRPGAEEAWVEGVFAIPEGLLDDPDLGELATRLPAGADEIVLGRRIGASGRTSAFVGGRAATAADLRALGPRLLAFFGQHEHRRLTLAAAQLEILDGFAGSSHREVLAEYRTAYAEAGAAGAELERLRDLDASRERDLDLIRFELAEIEAAAPDPGERAELDAERERLRHAEALHDAAAAAQAALGGGPEGDGGARGALAAAGGALDRVAGVDPRLDALGERLRAAALELDDLCGELRAHLDGAEAEPGRLAALEERLDALDRLQRKHGGSIESVLAHAEHCRAEIDRLANAERDAERLEAELGAARQRRAELAARLTARRLEAARGLEAGLAGELASLAMDGAVLEVALEPHPDGFGPAGAETAEFMVATNPGLPSSPLRDAASGGELSRIMLALIGLGGEGGGRTTVFDEIDAGIGGSTARAVGERLRSLAASGQVICITHLPQVASLADANFRIEKRATGDRALARVERVDGDELVDEIVRMLGGERGDATAGRHARQLLEAA